MSLRGRQIELWVEARDGQPAVNPIMQALLRELADAGARVTVRVPEHEVVDPAQLTDAGAPDLVLLKSATTLALSVAVAREAHGVLFLNPARATLRAHDKAATIARLAAAGLPVPLSFLMDQPAEETVSPEDGQGGWVVKPTRGVHGQGVAFHSDLKDALRAARDHDRVHGHIVTDGTTLVQRRIGPRDQADVKVYVAGETLFAGVKAFSTTSYASDRIEERSLNRDTQAVVRGVGQALELRCYGVDLRFEGDRPFIVDANPFPGYRGFPGAVEALRAEIERRVGARW